MSLSVSVIILAYREPEFLNGLLRGLAQQTLPPAEILIVDDASGADITSRYELPSNAHLLVNHERQALAAVSRNIARQHAHGDLVAFVDQDDLWHPEKLAIQVAALEAQPKALLHYTHVQLVDEALAPLPRQSRFVPLGTDPLASLLKRNTIAYSSVVMRRVALDSLGGFDESIRAAADWDMWLRVAAAGPMLADARPLLIRRMHGRQWSKSEVMISQGAQRVMAKATAWVARNRPDLLPRARRCHARWLRKLAQAQLDCRANPAEPLAALRQAIGLCPLDLRLYGLLWRTRWAATRRSRATGIA
jgi:glycosyltransferase involved in cell wall biosynthesis